MSEDRRSRAARSRGPREIAVPGSPGNRGGGVRISWGGVVGCGFRGVGWGSRTPPPQRSEASAGPSPNCQPPVTLVWENAAGNPGQHGPTGGLMGSTATSDATTPSYRDALERVAGDVIDQDAGEVDAGRFPRRGLDTVGGAGLLGLVRSPDVGGLGLWFGDA